MSKQAVHFTVDPDGLTRLIRDMWAEGSYARALRVVGSVNKCLTLEIQHDIIRGKKRFAGVPGSEDLCLKPDDWKPNLRQCAYGKYPDPTELATMAEGLNRISKEAEEMQEFIKDAHAEEDKEDEERAKPPLDRNAIYQHAALQRLEMMTGEKVNLESFMAKLNKSTDEAAPAEDVDCESGNGWIDRKGRFFPCGFMEHIWLAGVLGLAGNEREAEDRGWIKCYTAIIGKGCMKFRLEPTQRQIDKVFQWCERHGVELPDWAGGK